MGRNREQYYINGTTVIIHKKKGHITPTGSNFAEKNIKYNEQIPNGQRNKTIKDCAHKNQKLEKLFESIHTIKNAEVKIQIKPGPDIGDHTTETLPPKTRCEN